VERAEELEAALDEHVVALAASPDQELEQPPDHEEGDLVAEQQQVALHGAPDPAPAKPHGPVVVVVATVILVATSWCVLEEAAEDEAAVEQHGERQMLVADIIDIDTTILGGGGNNAAAAAGAVIVGGTNPRNQAHHRVEALAKQRCVLLRRPGVLTRRIFRGSITTNSSASASAVAVPGGNSGCDQPADAAPLVALEPEHGGRPALAVEERADAHHLGDVGALVALGEVLRDLANGWRPCGRRSNRRRHLLLHHLGECRGLLFLRRLRLLLFLVS